MRNFEKPGRSQVHSTNGMAATSHPLATQTAIDLLKAGGNAIDAAIAACATQCVVEPHSTGIGGDCFALYAPNGTNKIVAYNGSGRAPASATPEWYREHGITSIERQSAHAVTVPGAIDAWYRLAEDHGTRGLEELLQPAITYARDGYPVYSRVLHDWNLQSEIVKKDPTTAAIFAPGGKLPSVGSIHKQPLLAKTLDTIAKGGRDAFYRGPVAEDIVNYLNKLGGLHTLDDFAHARGEYVTPISTSYHGYDVFECPPNGQGLTALIILNILKGYNLTELLPLSTERLHLEIEASRLAYQDRNTYIADTAKSVVPVSQLLSENHADDLRSSIQLNKAMDSLPLPSLPVHADTVYLCVVDSDNNAVSFINSLFSAFGSGFTSPNTGVLLQNRGVAFSLDANHPNCIAPNKRPLHTIIPGMLTRNDKVVMPFGVMGGHYQATGHAHLLTNLLDFGMDIQESIDFPRVFPLPNGQLEAEGTIPNDILSELARLGHNVQPAKKPIGGGQAIWIDWEKGVLTGGSDPRKDGCAMGF
jgi:gamma-glutamyltranspeptidase/glutathione hydrolase